MSMEQTDSAALISNETDEEDAAKSYQTFWYRWYILIVFSFYSFVQTVVWNTWGPISISAKFALNFTDHDIELFANWVTIAALPCFPVFILMLNKTGLRLSTLLGAFCVALGTALRCLPVNVHALKYLVHVAQFLNGVAACSVLGVPPLLSNVWFPPSERVTATASIILLGNIGNAFGYFVGPQMVDRPINSSTVDGHVQFYASGNITNIPQMRNQISHLMYLHCGLAVLGFLSLLVFFPNKPPNPPSPTAAVERLSFLTSLKHLIRVRSYWAIVLTQALIFGSYYSWSGVFADLYGHFGISQTESGNVGAVMTLAGVVVGIILGLFVDRFKRQMKNVLVIIICVVFVVFLYLVVASMQWIDWSPFHFTEVTMWVCCVLIGVAINSFSPLITELAVDHAYPVNEGTSNSVLMWFSLLSMFIFLTTLNAVTDQTIANYLLLAFTGLAVPSFIFLVPQRNARLDIDLNG